MTDWLTADFNAVLKIFVSTFLILTALLIIVRISGLRSFAKMSSIDFATTIAIGSILASTMLSESPSVVRGACAIAFVLLYQTIFSKLTLHFNWFNRTASNQPMLLMDGENILYDNLHSSNLSEDDLMSKLREANVIQFSEVKAVILENTGDISVLHSKDEKDVDEKILQNVRRNNQPID